MLKINNEALCFDIEKYFYQGEIFTGISFYFVGGVLESATKYKNGENIGGYLNKYIPVEKTVLKVLFEVLESKNEDGDEPFYYEGDVFSGMAYDFDGGRCTGEVVYENGWQKSSVTYYLSGAKDAIELISENFSQKYYWYENSEIKRLEIFERNSFDSSFSFDSEGCIASISIDGNYFIRVNELGDKIKFNCFNNRSFLSELICSNYCYISGSAVDEEVFDFMIKNNGFKKTNILRICRTPLNIESLNKLIKFKNILELYIESEVVSIDDIKLFKSKRCDCYVEFNREEVLL